MLRIEELAANYAAVDALLEESGGEVTEDIERLQAALDDSLPERVDQTRHVVRRAQAKKEILQGEKRSLLALLDEVNRDIGVEERRIARWQGWLKAALQAAGLDSARGHHFKVSVVPSPPRVEVASVAALPEGYKRVTVEADRAALLEAYRAGETLPEGVTVERGSHLRFS
jgi:hypothetical protein